MTETELLSILKEWEADAEKMQEKYIKDEFSRGLYCGSKLAYRRIADLISEDPDWAKHSLWQKMKELFK